MSNDYALSAVAKMEDPKSIISAHYNVSSKVSAQNLQI